ncbi:MAG: hypothetical protein WC023_00740 [Rhodocyclaceae bacterium]
MPRLNRANAVFVSLLLGAAFLLSLATYLFFSNKYLLAWLIAALGFAAWGLAAKLEEERSSDLKK